MLCWADVVGRDFDACRTSADYWFVGEVRTEAC